MYAPTQHSCPGGQTRPAGTASFLSIRFVPVTFIAPSFLSIGFPPQDSHTC
eukprot:EC796371.1.p2 GENE.EC796371.1~~EC796371.1.p2  ORF type:complete len:51 (-),score=0.19 EC796371.1:2-154(-)